MPVKAIYRLKQFWFSMSARYLKADETFARSYLTIEEMALFGQLPEFEKKHSVVVARKMLAASRLYPELDSRKLVRLGLLHDIGKMVEHNSIITKSILVIIRFFFPRFFNWLADKGKDHRCFHRFYIHKHHGAEGARLLEKIGESADMLSIIAKHDPRICPFAPEDPVELKILQEADSTY